MLNNVVLFTVVPRHTAGKARRGCNPANNTWTPREALVINDR